MAILGRNYNIRRSYSQRFYGDTFTEIERNAKELAAKYDYDASLKKWQGVDRIYFFGVPVDPGCLYKNGVGISRDFTEDELSTIERAAGNWGKIISAKSWLRQIYEFMFLGPRTEGVEGNFVRYGVMNYQVYAYLHFICGLNIMGERDIFDSEDQVPVIKKLMQKAGVESKRPA